MTINKFVLAPIAAALLLSGCQQERPSLDNPGFPAVYATGEAVDGGQFDDPTYTGSCEDPTLCWSGWNVIRTGDSTLDAFVYGEVNQLVTMPAGGWPTAEISNWDDRVNGTSGIQTLGQSEELLTDALTGQIVSAPILLENDYIQLQLGGGSWSINAMEGMTGAIIELLPQGADESYSHTQGGDVIGWASGENANTLNWKAFDVSAYNDGTRYVRMRIVDQNTVGWGQVIADNVYVADEPVEGAEKIANQVITNWNSSFVDDVQNNKEGMPIRYVTTPTINTCVAGGGCDSTTGTLSNRFVVDAASPYLNFTIAGGDVGKQVYAELKLDDSVLLTEYPKRCTLNDALDLQWVTWDLSEYVGQEVTFNLVDNEQTGCGFLVADLVHTSAVAQTESAQPAKEIANFNNEQPGTTPTGWESTFTENVVGNQEGSPAIIGQGINTCIGGGACDSTTGEMTSPAFTIEQDYVQFMTIGGSASAQVFIKLLVDINNDGQFAEQFSETPTTCGAWADPYWVNWDVSALKDKQAKVQIIDAEVGGCGFIVVDEIYQANQVQ